MHFLEWPMNKSFSLLVLAAALSVLTIPACAQDSDDLAYRLATIAARSDLAMDDPLVAKAADLLERAATAFGEPREQVVNLTMRGLRLLHDRAATPLDILEAALAAPPGGSFSGALSRYVTLRNRGKSHAETLTAMAAKSPGG